MEGFTTPLNTPGMGDVNIDTLEPIVLNAHCNKSKKKMNSLKKYIKQKMQERSNLL